ncbi:MAG: hypothetical protein ACO32I_07165 [Candidatus Limnocylindrus sp.]
MLDLANIKAKLEQRLSPETLIRARADAWFSEFGTGLVSMLVTELEHTQAERDHYFRALSWYGDAENWRFHQHPKGGWAGAEAADDGQRARAALAAFCPREV